MANSSNNISDFLLKYLCQAGLVLIYEEGEIRQQEEDSWVMSNQPTLSRLQTAKYELSQAAEIQTTVAFNIVHLPLLLILHTNTNTNTNANANTCKYKYKPKPVMH